LGEREDKGAMDGGLEVSISIPSVFRTMVVLVDIRVVVTGREFVCLQKALRTVLWWGLSY